MSDLVKSILSRRSIRSFTSAQIKEEELSTIIEAGQYAPSAKNEQTWHFSVVQNKELLTKIDTILRRIFLNSGDQGLQARASADNFSAFYHAPTLIIVSADQTAIAPEPDASLALGNILLAAHAIGVGSVWIHSLRSLFSSDEGKALQKDLGIPDGYTIYGSAALGYNGGDIPNAAPRKTGTVSIIK
ncbi:MAG: nitroreductase family protein [Pelosinus sp.]|nr:nitroreductase family protein [Pelosinus sp.]